MASTFDWTDTIVGPATPTATGAGGCRAILRVSGPHAHDLVRALAGQDTTAEPLQKPIVQDALLSIAGWEDSQISCQWAGWPPGRSATGQAISELHLPQCLPLLDAVQADLIARGARLARPGEFTLRAFLAGRLDLTQAEAILGVIEADDLNRLHQALDQRAGGVSQRLRQLKSDLLDLLADLEAGLDFAEEEDISFVADDEIHRRLQDARDQLAQQARLLQQRALAGDRAKVVLVGAPNAGKSSLFNALIRQSAQALVSDQAGTTRDYIVAPLPLAADENNTPMVVDLIDTAGWDPTQPQHSIDSRSQQLGHQQAQQADLLLVCHPANGSADAMVLPPSVQRESRVIHIGTKADLNANSESRTKGISIDLAVSIHDQESLENLRQFLADAMAQERRVGQSPILRTQSALGKALQAATASLEALEHQLGPEILALSIREILDCLAEVLGEVYTDDVLDRVFSRFCIGK